MTPQERHAARHALVVAEIDALTVELASARARSAAADVAYQRANAEWLEFSTFATTGLRPAQAVSARFHGWLQEVRLELMKPAEDERRAARGAVPTIEQRLADARDELANLSRALAGEKVTALHAHTVVPRPKPTPIEFDTITQRETI